MPAINVDDITVLDRLPRPDVTDRQRPVRKIVSGRRRLEGAGFEVTGAFADLPAHATDPFIIMDEMGPSVYQPYEAKGAPWHPHRGFETVSYMIDGAMVHHDSNGGGGVIGEGDTQWMTAGSGVLHDELPSEQIVMSGGRMHGVQLWVNLPKAKKMVAPRYQDLRSDELALVSSHDGGALVRIIAGEIGGFSGPGSTYTPIAYAHVSISPGGQFETPWPKNFGAMAYMLSGEGGVGADNQPVRAGQLALFGPGDALTVSADRTQHTHTGNVEVLLLGGLPLREAVVQYGPFVMNSRAEIVQAMEDFQAGRLGTIPAKRLGR